ncbi:MAG: alanine racemase [Acidobacteriota bacterium]
MKSWIELNSKNLKHNLDIFKKKANGSKVLFAVKANAYGHGLKEILSITKDLNSFEYYGVDSISEAKLVKDIDKNKNILILGWSDEDELELAIREEIEFVAPSIGYLEKANRIASKLNRKGMVHLKVETGTSRLGADPEELAGILENFPYENLVIKGIYSHFANIEDTTDHSYARKQLKIFNKFLKKIGKNDFIKHFSCSASSLLFPETYFDMVRVGISAYGFWPSKQTYVSFNEKNGGEIELKPVLSWYSKVAQVKDLDRGTYISYGLTYKTYDRSEIVVIPVGYYDGYNRELSNISKVIINGDASPVRGRVCMDMFMSEVTHIKGVREGDRVILIGEENGESITVDFLADLAGTINYEFISRLNPMIPRIVI